MEWAINSETGERVSSVIIETDPSYCLKEEDIWFADPNDIESYNKELVKDVNKIQVKYRKGSTKINQQGTKFEVIPHWFIPNKEKLGINIVPESKEHKIAKLFIYNKLKEKDLTFKYSTINKPNSYDNFIKFKDLDIDYQKIGREINCSNGKRQIADIIIPFKEYHSLFGNGIIIEIQFSKQYDKTTKERSLNWALKGFSVCWLWEPDFEIFTTEQIKLRNVNIKVEVMTNILKVWKEEAEKNLYFQIQSFSRQLDDKIEKLERLQQKKPSVLGVCPVCKNGQLLLKKGRFGDFYGCSNYPTCKKITNLK